MSHEGLGTIPVRARSGPVLSSYPTNSAGASVLGSPQGEQATKFNFSHPLGSKPARCSHASIGQRMIGDLGRDSVHAGVHETHGANEALACDASPARPGGGGSVPIDQPFPGFVVIQPNDPVSVGPFAAMTLAGDQSCAPEVLDVAPSTFLGYPQVPGDRAETRVNRVLARAGPLVKVVEDSPPIRVSGLAVRTP